MAREDQPLGFEPSGFARRIKSSVSVDELPWKGEQSGHLASRILIRLGQVEGIPRVRVGVQEHIELPIVGSAKGETALARVIRAHVTRYGIGKGEVNVHS